MSRIDAVPTPALRLNRRIVISGALSLAASFAGGGIAVAKQSPGFARWVEAPAPLRVGVEDALKAAGAEAVYFHTSLTGAANSRAKAQFGFTPRPLAWKSHLV